MSNYDSIDLKIAFNEMRATRAIFALHITSQASSYYLFIDFLMPSDDSLLVKYSPYKAFQAMNERHFREDLRYRPILADACCALKHALFMRGAIIESMQ